MFGPVDLPSLSGVLRGVVELCRRGDCSVGQVAKDFDLTETAVRDWVKQARVDVGERDALTSDEREEVARLRRENRRLREDVDILRRATAFSTSSRGPGRVPMASAEASQPFRASLLEPAQLGQALGSL
ncbi:transposase [Kitasatospora cinereorecta]|uniref:Transposase n=1 Tax=Kitasatospora cinereorecta TaxID=285560 RepID=A0ABW0V7E0_9ACTN